MQEQEINTRALKAKREKRADAQLSSKCRFCGKKREDIFHLLCCCDNLSASLYLPMRHDEVAKTIYNEIIRNHFKNHPYVHPENVWKRGKLELWWDTHISTAPKVKHNKPDIVIWDIPKKKCTIVDICVPLNINVSKQEKAKMDIYMPLIVALVRIYSTYKFEVVPIVIGAMGLVTDSLVKQIKKVLEDEEKDVKGIVTKLQQKALIGSMRILKSALSMKPS